MSVKPKERKWSRKFLDLAGSAPDFPYPEEPPPAEPGLSSSRDYLLSTDVCGDSRH
jgi:hypothetical protein